MLLGENNLNKESNSVVKKKRAEKKEMTKVFTISIHTSNTQ